MSVAGFGAVLEAKGLAVVDAGFVVEALLADDGPVRVTGGRVVGADLALDGAGLGAAGFLTSPTVPVLAVAPAVVVEVVVGLGRGLEREVAGFDVVSPPTFDAAPAVAGLEIGCLVVAGPPTGGTLLRDGSDCVVTLGAAGLGAVGAVVGRGRVVEVVAGLAVDAGLESTPLTFAGRERAVVVAPTRDTPVAFGADVARGAAFAAAGAGLGAVVVVGFGAVLPGALAVAFPLTNRAFDAGSGLVGDFLGGALVFNPALPLGASGLVGDLADFTSDLTSVCVLLTASTGLSVGRVRSIGFGKFANGIFTSPSMS